MAFPMAYPRFCSYPSTGVCQSERLLKLQNTAASLVTFSHINIASSTLLSDLGWDRRSKQLAITLFEIRHNLAPNRLSGL